MATESTLTTTFEEPSMSSTSESSTEFIVDDAELLSILAADPLTKNEIHAFSNSETSTLHTPSVALLDWDDWSQDVPEFINEDLSKKRKRGNTPSDSDDDDEEDFNFLDQFEFVDVSFDEESAPDAKKPKTTSSFVDENADDISSLLQQSDSLINETDYRWTLDITS